jgi:hypothetical protein
MKTQLLQDFDESGSKAAQPQQAEQPYAAPPAAVWHRPQAPVTPTRRSAPPAQSVQRADPGSMAGSMDATVERPPPAASQMRPPGAEEPGQASRSRQRAREGVWTGPRPLPPDTRAAATEATDIPEWLSERLREDAEQDAQRQRSRLVARRALSWSAAATVVAMLAVAGYWFYQESRVEGALNVVANTSPAPPAAVAAAGASVHAAVPAPAASVTPAVPSSAAGTTAPSADRTVTRVELDAGAPVRVQASAAQPAAAQDNIDRPAPHRKRHAKAITGTQATADTGPTPAQRREETLMQCRVLGYDARECTRRGCMMTRFGLACPG